MDKRQRSGARTERVVVGKIVAPQGIRGEVRVLPLSDRPDRWRTLRRVWIRPAQTPSQPLAQTAQAAPPARGPVRVERGRPHQSVWLLKLEGVNTRNDAEALRGSELEVPMGELDHLAEGEYYVHDLVGLPVQDEAGASLGELADVLKTGANDVFVVRRGDGREVLLPAVREFVRVDLTQGRIVVRPIPGMFDE